MTERVTREIDRALFEVGLKQCAKCHNIKDVEEFALDRAHWTGRQSYCRVDNNARMRDHFQGGRDPNKPWTRNQVSYQAAHKRVRLINGSARKHLCVDTGEQAQDWSYIGGDVDELYETIRGSRLAYSLKPEFYVPRTRKAHQEYDRGQRTA